MSASDELWNKVSRLRDQLRDAEDKHKKSLLAKQGWRLGDTIEGPAGARGKIIRVEYGGYRHNASIRVIVTLYRKDGTLGSRGERLWDYEFDQWHLASREGESKP